MVLCTEYSRGTGDFFLTKCFCIALLLFFSPIHTPAQDGPDAGGREVQVWTGGGHGTNGRTSDTALWNVGVRYGWILTGEHGPRLLRGRFEYAVDAVPVVVVFQKTNTAYGAGINPLGLKWNFSGSRRVVPYCELSGGTLFTNAQVPEGSSRVNFTSSGACGLHFLRQKYNASVELRFTHISNAGIATLNPGVNILQVRIGVGRFSRRR